MTLVLRTTKGSPLTYSELDNNFTYLSSLITNSNDLGYYYPNSSAYTPPVDTTNGDWSTAIQAAITDANANGGGCVYLAPGTYHLSTSLNILSNVTLLGSDRTSTKLITSSATASLITIPVNTSNWEVRNLNLSNTSEYPDRKVGGNQFGIYVCGQLGVVHNCDVHNVVVGIVLNGARDCVISNNFVHDTTADGISMFGAEFGPNKRNLIIANRVDNTGDDGIAEVWYMNHTNFPNEDNTIIGNILTNILATGVSLWGGTRTIVCGNKITNTLNCGIRTNAAASIGFGNVSYANIYGNTITNAGKSPVRRESGDASVTEKCAGIMVQTWSDNGTLSDIKIHDNIIISPAGSYIAALNREGATTISNLSITENVCTGGNTIPSSVAGKESSGVGHGIWINNVKNLTLRGNTVNKALGNGICLDVANTGISNVSENTIVDCNQGTINPAAAISINSTNSFIGLGNAISDGDSRLVNGVYINPAIGVTLFTTGNNILGGRALSTTPANGNSTPPPVGSGYFTEEFTALNESGTFEGWTVGYQGEGAPYTYGTLDAVNGTARLTPLANVSGIDYITLLTNKAFDLKGNSVTVKLKSLPTDAFLEVSFVLFNAAYQRARLGVLGSSLGVEVVTGSSNYSYPIDGQNVAPATFLRFSESNGTLLLMKSLDGISWDTVYSFPNPYGNTNFRFGLQVGYYNRAVANPSYQDFESVQYSKNQ